ncbi:MAG: glutamine-hydrolyzing GMP synthase [Candidatus Levybacteria bacterium]|nr:glutamine-hydrolyzing GMP synthase [Candidatus Levybacteria bacterium]
MIIIVDFGSQTTHLIARRLKEIGVQVLIANPDDALEKIKKKKPQGIVLSGGPSSVYEKGAPTIDVKIFSLKIPILGICYGLQLTAHLLGGRVIAGKKEYGPTTLEMKDERSEMRNKNFPSLISQFSSKLPRQFIVWMSHGDEVVRLPKGFQTVGSSVGVPFAFVENKYKKIYGLQFHPEVEHTQFGLQILENFIGICHSGLSRIDSGVTSFPRMTERIISEIQKTVGESYVIGAVSGGVDSTVAATLTAKAIGKRFVPVFIDNGLMRKGTEEHVIKIFKKIGIKPVVVNVTGETMSRLKKITDSEKKRKIIGNFYIEIFESVRRKLLKKKIPVKFLLQGTIYSDVIESQGTKHSAKIKSHHNVGGLPKKMKLKLLEPMRDFYKDEVRKIGRKLGLPEEFVSKQTFPGPGYAVRIRGEVTKERLEMEKMADEIVLSELEKSGIPNIFMSFPVMTDAYSTAVKGDGRQFGEVVALRVIESKDLMTTTWARLPYDLLQKISSRIVNEVPGVSRVVYDITTKPPATMEWE